MTTRYLVRNSAGHMEIMDDPGTLEILDSYEVEQPPDVSAIEWGWLLSDVDRFQKWLGRLDPAYPVVMDHLRTPVSPFSYEARYAEALAVFDLVVKSDPRPPLDKFAAMGSPKLLLHYFGLVSSPPTGRDLAIMRHVEETGYAESGHIDPRKKIVREPATGLQWDSAKDLARALGCSVQTVYAHLSGRLKSCHGRIFEYCPRAAAGPVPGSIDAMSPEERERSRALARSLGFIPRY